MNNFNDTKNIVKGWEMKWYAKSKVVFSGKLFIGPPRHRNLALSLIFFIIVSLIAWMAKYSMFESEVNSLFLFFLYIITTSLAFLYFLLTTFTDPGVLFRHKDYEYF